ncbi:MAG: aminoglycoside phosphotransferase family protein [Anaerolineae bacterium]|nr:aminoglycoside phosphotransferase family protein [Anaerolineae bacterium]
MQNIIRAAAQFTLHPVIDVREYGSGNVNDTYLVSCVDDAACPDSPFVLQRINTAVFVHPEQIMVNMRTFSEHVLARMACENEADNHHHWVMPHVIPARDGQDFFIDDEGGFWRALSFVNNSRTMNEVRSRDHAREAGYALGHFHRLISDLPPEQLHDTLPGFHIAPQYVAQYERAVANPQAMLDTPEAQHGLRFIEARKGWAGVLETAKAKGQLQMRPIHGDPKINNIMIEDTTGHAISLIDLDTVKPGLVHYDIGDCLRSCCNPLGEETEQIDQVCFDTDLCRVILQGYLSEAQEFLTDQDYAYMYDGIRLISFELGLRFFTDYLNGDVYFKVKDETHNLRRALVQFKVAESIEAQEGQIRAIIEDMRP